MKTMTRPPTLQRSNALGMTLIELLIALTIFGVIITVALSFMTQQNSAFQNAVDRMSALRNVRYAVTAIGRDLETLGTSVPGHQPSLLYADSSVITFSADYATNVAGDPFAVFYDPDLPTGQVRAPVDSFAVPTTGVFVADTAYQIGGGIMSPAEILSFFFVADTSTARSDDFVLYRQVNGRPAEVLARNILRVPGEPFLSYEREMVDTAGIRSLELVPDSLMPIFHSAPIHLSLADTAASAFADSVRVVRLAIAGTNGLTGAQEHTVETLRRVTLPNAGRTILATCGSAPLFGGTLTATPTLLPGGESAVELAWGQAIDEVGGETDVVRYVLWRRPFGSTDWGEPYVAIPAGAASYTYLDATVTSGSVLEFAVAAQDCTPTFSALASSGVVVVL